MHITNVRILLNYDQTCIGKLHSSVQIASCSVKNGVVYIKLDSNNKEPIYLSCTISHGNQSSSALEIPNFLLKRLHLKCDDLITLTILDPSTVPCLTSVSLDALPLDFDVLRSHEADLEQSFLRQCTFVYLGMQLPVWCANGSQLVYCTVTNFHPISIESRCGRLGISTTLHLDCPQLPSNRSSGSFSRAVALGNQSAGEEAVVSPDTSSAVAAVIPAAQATPVWVPKVLWALANFVCRWLLGYGVGLSDLIQLRAACASWSRRLTLGSPFAAGLGSGGRFDRPVLLQVRPVNSEDSRLLSEPNCALVNPRHLPPPQGTAYGANANRWSIVQLLPLGPQFPAEKAAFGADPVLVKLLPCGSTPPDCLHLCPAAAAAAGLGWGVWVRLAQPRDLLEQQQLASDCCLRVREVRLRGAGQPEATRLALEGFLKERSAENPVLIVQNRKMVFTDADNSSHHCAATELVVTTGKQQQQQQRHAPPCALLLCREISPRLRVTVAPTPAATAATSAATTVEEAAEKDDAEDHQQLPLPDWLSDSLSPLVASLEDRFNNTAVLPRQSYLALLRTADPSAAAGSGQSGKSALLRQLASRLRSRGFCCVGVGGGSGGGDLLDCRRLARLEFASARRRLWTAARLAAARAPACLCLDNLEAMCCPVEDALVGTAMEVQLTRQAHIIRSLLKWLRHQPGLMLVATAGGPVNQHLVDSATGQCLFDSDSHLDLYLTPTDDMRRLLSAAAGCDRLAPGEYARCLHILDYCRSSSSSSSSPAAAAGEFQPLGVAVTLASVRQNREECDPMRACLPLEYDQIRGLDAAKEVLERAIVWPLRYPQLVRRIRGQGPGASATAGVLLTGPSGCGKSLLARALARRLGIRLLAVRGPELLSKFIGASERAVRELFAKARRLRPCLVFLDEVDALAPRRGNDTTGVTDRVVNQLLTELDGLDSDGLAGVAFLAATNRPDLVDPALLRPGRIGLRAVCPAPDLPARREILASLLPQPPPPDDGDDLDLLNTLAARTEGYCSADFNALLLEATAACVSDSNEAAAAIGPRQLLGALNCVRPSLTAAAADGNSGEGLVLKPGQRVMFA